MNPVIKWILILMGLAIVLSVASFLYIAYAAKSAVETGIDAIERNSDGKASKDDDDSGDESDKNANSNT